MPWPIESPPIFTRNAVGYQSNSVTNGNQGVGATFLAIDGEMKMGDIRIVGYGDEYGDGNISCTKLDTFGRNIKDMYWYDVKEWDDDEDPGDIIHHDTIYGWYAAGAEGLGEDTCYNEDALTAGEGLWFHLYVPGCDITVQSAGQVLNQLLPVAVTNGNQMCINPTPIPVKMGNVVISGYGDEYGDGNISCTKLDTFGRNIKDMYWYDVDEWDDDEDPGDIIHHDTIYGWYAAGAEGLEEDVCYNEDLVNPGEGLWLHVYAPGQQIYINWPSAQGND